VTVHNYLRATRPGSREAKGRSNVWTRAARWAIPSLRHPHCDTYTLPRCVLRVSINLSRWQHVRIRPIGQSIVKDCLLDIYLITNYNSGVEDKSLSWDPNAIKEVIHFSCLNSVIFQILHLSQSVSHNQPDNILPSWYRIPLIWTNPRFPFHGSSRTDLTEEPFWLSPQASCFRMRLLTVARLLVSIFLARIADLIPDLLEDSPVLWTSRLPDCFWIRVCTWWW